MQAHDCGDSVLAADPVDQFEDPDRGRRIEACHRFVGEQGVRTLNQRACNTDALLLTAGKFVGPAERPVEQLNAVEHLERLATLGPRGWKQRPQRAVKRETAEHDICQYRLTTNEVMLLENHRGLLTLTPQARRAAEDRLSGRRENIAPRWPYQSVETAQESRFARPGRSKQHGEAAAVERQTGPVKRADAIMIDDGSVVNFEHKG